MQLLPTHKLLNNFGWKISRTLLMTRTWYSDIWVYQHITNSNSYLNAMSLKSNDSAILALCWYEIYITSKSMTQKHTRVKKYRKWNTSQHDRMTQKSSKLRSNVGFMEWKKNIPRYSDFIKKRFSKTSYTGRKGNIYPPISSLLEQ